MKRYLVDSNKLLVMLGGMSSFTLKSTYTGAEYTYFIKKAPVERSTDVRDKFTNTYFIKLFNGYEYIYAGCMKFDKVLETYKFMRTRDGKYDVNSKEVRALMWTLNNVNNDKGNLVEIYHHGRCCSCGENLIKDSELKEGVHDKCKIDGLKLIKVGV